MVIMYNTLTIANDIVDFKEHFAQMHNITNNHESMNCSILSRFPFRHILFLDSLSPNLPRSPILPYLRAP